MIDERPYDPANPCPKCGNPLCASEYRSGWEMWSLQLFPRMVRHCGRCDHRWYELPLDHDADREAEQLAAWSAARKAEFQANR